MEHREKPEQWRKRNVEQVPGLWLNLFGRINNNCRKGLPNQPPALRHRPD
jgi:hypothetical protein